MKTLLITGGAGFIGSNFTPLFIDNNKNTKIVVLDSLTYAGEQSNLNEVQNNNRYSFVKGNICNKQLVEQLFKKHQFQGVIHFAAESHVDNTIFTYKCDNYYNKESQDGILYNDPFLNINWNLKEDEIILSDKDKILKSFDDFQDSLEFIF